MAELFFMRFDNKRRIRYKGMSSRAKRYAYESSGSGDSSTSGECFCNYGLRAPLQVSNSVANPGREYYSCPAKRCRYFTWAGPAIHGTTMLGGQICERNPEEHKTDSHTNLHLHDRVAKIEADYIRLKLLACMNIIGFVFCMFMMLVLLLKI
ncbi:hypothetical protein PIB30_076643 [Stylosanthes scabra]|uniref:GRF-type domain-containing protein n=2 Tax=Stylosanthes scabra TaxID=79078 RepID=A0ABU6UP31_9FABA|nr:hypothetical protein [Stylosanthes scabra]